MLVSGGSPMASNREEKLIKINKNKRGLSSPVGVLSFLPELSPLYSNAFIARLHFIFDGIVELFFLSLRVYSRMGLHANGFYWLLAPPYNRGMKVGGKHETKWSARAMKITKTFVMSRTKFGSDIHKFASLRVALSVCFGHWKINKLAPKLIEQRQEGGRVSRKLVRCEGKSSQWSVVHDWHRLMIIYECLAFIYGFRSLRNCPIEKESMMGSCFQVQGSLMCSWKLTMAWSIYEYLNEDN